MGQSDIEVWEIQSESTVFVFVSDPRAPGGYRQQRVGGAGTKRLRISRGDREFTQEQILEENRHMDPFTNGVLVQLEGGERVEGSGITFEDLRTMLSVEDLDTFTEAVREIPNELTVRRLREVAESHGTVAQLEAVRNVIEERWKVGGTQRTVREMIAAGESAGGQLISG